MYGRRENRLMGRSEELFERAVKVIPGGVNSPVRAYGSVGMTPRLSMALRARIFLTWTERSISITLAPGAP